MMRTSRKRVTTRLQLQLNELEARTLLSTLFVDDDHAQNPSAPYTSIQAAVIAASPGDTIKVSPGIYNESVTVPKTLTLLGAQSGRDVSRLCDRTPDPTRESIVDPPDTALNGFSLQADNITLDGFRVQGATGNAGIYTSPAFSGYRILNNIIQDNTFGLYLNSSGARASFVSGNCIDNNNRPGAASGNGIYADQGTQRVVIDQNRFSRNTNAGIIFANAATPQNDIAITRNRSTDDATFVALFNTDRVAIAGNTVRDTNPADNVNQGSAIFVGGDNNDILVASNDIGSGPYSGVAVRDVLGAPPTNVDIIGNSIRGRDLNGIDVTTAGPGAVEVRRNEVRDNGKDGIYFGPLTNGNLIADNFAKGNREHDCHDDSVGTGTGGTANTWRNDTGFSDNRGGQLCRPSNNGNNGHDDDDDHDHHGDGHGHDDHDDDHDGHGHGRGDRNNHNR